MPSTPAWDGKIPHDLWQKWLATPEQKFWRTSPGDTFYTGEGTADGQH